MVINQQLFNIIHYLTGKNRILDVLGIFLADYLGYFLVLIALILLFSQKNIAERYRWFLFTAFSLVISRGLFTEIIRYFFPIQRPFVVYGFTPLVNHDVAASFPSGHMALFFTLALCVFYLIGKKWGWRFIVAVLIMGLARIFAGVHWPLDILGGITISLMAFFITYFLFPKNKKINQPSA
ncbi:MAG: phosphatase PAP2 family protein [Candidatus Pacebacteria bacterium]|nr:phosphatase PAP2 family protein [Candidatus Paceibacterota bacterium]